MPTYVHVNSHKIRANRKNNTADPVIVVRRGKSTRYAREVRINGPCRVVYSACKPLKCGAVVYLVVPDGVEVEVIDDDGRAETRAVRAVQERP